MDNQLGFRNTYFTQSAITSFYDKVLNAIDDGEYLIWILCDFSRAFDCGQHKILMN